MKLSEQLLNHLKRNNWVHKGELLKMDWSDNGVSYMPDTVSRELRKLESESKIEVKPDGNKSIMYRYLYAVERDTYIPQSKRLKTLL